MTQHPGTPATAMLVGMMMMFVLVTAIVVVVMVR